MTSGVMKMKRPFSLRRVGKEWNRENILRFLGYILAAFVINLALECLSRRSLGDGLHYMVTRPWQFFYDSLIILFTLSLSLLFRKRSFCFLLFAAVWIGLGLANCILLGFRDVELVTLIAIFASPSAVSSFPMAQQMDSDAELAGDAVVFSSMFSCFTIFLWIFAAKSLGLF